MLNTLLGTKVKMGQAYVAGSRVPVTNIKLGPCVVTQTKTQEKDGYVAIQLGFGQKRIKNITKPEKGHLSGAIKGKYAPRFLREVRSDQISDLKVGDELKVEDVFKKGDIVSVTSISKGKGFAGVVKRWKFAGGPKTHGQSDRQRAPGSIGQGTTPGRVYKGTVTIKNLVVVDVEPEQGILSLSGSVPGSVGSLIKVKKIAHGKLEELLKEEVQQAVSAEDQEVQEEAVEEKSSQPDQSKKDESETEVAEKQE